MELTLPSSKKMVIKSMPRKSYRELMALQKKVSRLAVAAQGGDEAADVELMALDGGSIREDLTLGCYPEIKNPDDMTQRDLAFLMTATEEFSKGVSEKVIKNLLGSGSPKKTRKK